MCGIFGIVFRDTETQPDPSSIADSLRFLAHRGPDSDGWIQEPGLALAHTRLSLVDLSERGRQPFWDSKKRFCMVYNGEVYNFRELRSELEGDGVAFRTTTDTEVVLEAMIRWGAEATLQRLAGMFALALYDRDRRRLLLARDRYGIKPLLVYDDGTRFVFSSEAKALRPWLQLEPNPWALAAFLAGHGGPTKNDSFYRNVRILPPGTLLEIPIGGKPQEKTFIMLSDFMDGEQELTLARRKPNQLVDELDELLNQSVKDMLFADAPVGALCSGGVDSSVIMAIAARYHSDLKIFHADVVGPWSEYEAALSLSRHLGLELHRVQVRDQDFIDSLPDTTWHYEYPFRYHPNSIAFHAVSRLVRENGVKAVLSGEGADECFLGYPWIAREPVNRFFQERAQASRRFLSSNHLLARILGAERDRTSASLASLFSGFERDGERKALEADYRDRHQGRLHLNARTLVWLGYHLRSLLHRNDSLGMAASIEARFPFLDERLVRFAVNLPHRYKIRLSPLTFERAHPLFRDKWVLRKVADRYIPASLSQRKKMGFHVNAFERMHIPADYFSADGFVATYLRLGHRELAHLLETAPQEQRIRLMMLEVWGRVCLWAEDRERTRASLRAAVQCRPGN